MKERIQEFERTPPTFLSDVKQQNLTSKRNRVLALHHHTPRIQIVIISYGGLFLIVVSKANRSIGQFRADALDPSPDCSK